MLALEVQVEFAEILVKLRERQATVSDLSQLLSLVRLYRKEIPDEVKLVILSIPSTVLRDNCKLKTSVGEWASENGKYFCGNCGSLWEWKEKFNSKCFDLQDMSNFMKYVLEDQERLNSDFYLRNPEVTLRDDVCIKSERKFQNEQIIYAMVLEKALMM
jgi:hypothetical protein